MKKILPFLKSRWLIIVLGVIALAGLPALWFVSNGMAKDTAEKFQKRVETDYKDVTNCNVGYGLVSPTGEKILEKSEAVNRARITAYKEIGEKLQAQTSVVSKSARDLNTDGDKHKPLIDGLFPAPTDLERLSKPKDFARALLQTERPKLLAMVHAGMPPSPTEVGQVLTDLAQSRRDEIKQNQGRTELDTQETEALNKDLLNLRLSRYQSRAAEIQVYADATIFDEVPADSVDNTAALPTVWDWQEKFWAHEDLLRAVVAANGDSGKRGVPGSIIKRITKLNVETGPYAPATGGGTGAVDTKPFEAGTDRAPTDFTKSITGRFSGPGSNNKWYDIRSATVEIVADAKRLPAFIDALASVNFMTVIDADLMRVDPSVDLREGFYYGDEPVVKATLTIETVWFREWREPWMPVEVKRAMGMDKDAPVAAAAGGAAPSRRGGGASPPRTPNKPPAGGDEGGGGGRRGGREGG